MEEENEDEDWEEMARDDDDLTSDANDDGHNGGDERGFMIGSSFRGLSEGYMLTRSG